MKRIFKTKHLFPLLVTSQVVIFLATNSRFLELFSSNTRPHIILILADDLGYRDVGYHGSRIKTPHIDRLAMSGIRLENYYTQALCSPTRGQLLTGRYQIHTGFQWLLWPPSPMGLSLEETTIAERLRELGYATHIVGKWHLGYFKKNYLPTNRGFDSFFGTHILPVDGPNTHILPVDGHFDEKPYEEFIRASLKIRMNFSSYKNSNF